MPDTVVLSNVNQLPRVTAPPLYHETPEAAAVRCAAAWGCPVRVYRVQVTDKAPGSVFVGKVEEGE